MLDLLARKGADLNARTNTGANLAHIAARDGESGCLKVLCERGADVDAVNQLGNTPAMFAAMAGDVDVSFFLFRVFRHAVRCLGESLGFHVCGLLVIRLDLPPDHPSGLIYQLTQENAYHVFDA